MAPKFIVPPPYTATTADPGGRPAPSVPTSTPVTQAQAIADSQAMQHWIEQDMRHKESLPQLQSDGGKGVSN